MTVNRRVAVFAGIGLSLIPLASASAIVTSGPGGQGVTVGNSSLISTRDLSDSFTLTANGGIAGRTVNTFPVPAAGLAVEFTNGHAPRSWPGSQWSISNDANAINGGTVYPGGSGAGSATGMTQTGSGGQDWGVSYGLRNVYTVQLDAVQVNDRVDIVSSSGQNTIGGGLAVFFRKSGGFSGFGEIGLYNGAVETNTGLTTGTSLNQWNNYAVRFNRINNTAEFFVNEASRGVVNLNTFAGGIYANTLANNNFINVGTANGGGDRIWTDNFQVGTASAFPAGLVTYHSFDESTGTTSFDNAFAHNGTLGAGVSRTTGAVGSGVSFNDTAGAHIGIGNGTLGIDNRMAFSTGIAVEALIKPTWNGQFFNYDEIFRKEDGGNRILLSFQNDPNNGGANPAVPGGPVLSFGLNVGGVYRELDMPLDGVAGRPTLAQLEDGNFHHVVATYDSTTGLKALYIDGILAMSVIESGLIASGGGAIATIGNVGPGGGEPFSGVIDEFALYGRALSQSEIAAHLANVRRGQNYFATAAVVLPEPATLTLLSLGGLLAMRRRRVA